MIKQQGTQGPYLNHSLAVNGPFVYQARDNEKCDAIKQLFFFKLHFCPYRRSLTQAAVALEGNLTRFLNNVSIMQADEKKKKKEFKLYKHRFFKLESL